MKIREIQENRAWGFAAAAALFALTVTPAELAAQTSPQPVPSITYADAVDLGDAAGLVVKARIRKQSTLPVERSPGVRPGWVRQLIEAETETLISGRVPIGESLRYLVDVPLDAKGKPPKLKKQSVLLFARPVAGRPGELQLVDVDAQLAADPATEALVRRVMTALAANNAPPRVTGIREALSVPGNLAGESETQLFMNTSDGAPVSLSIIRRPGMQPEWGVSWSELVDEAAQPLVRDTLEWYRLACFLPDTLPPEAIISRDGASRVLASQDYNFVRQALGACLRKRGGPPRPVAGL